VLIKVGPQSSPGMVPSRPRRRGRQIGDRRWGGCRSDQASEEGREGGRSRFGGQRTATRHLGLGRDRHTVNPRRHGQRLRTWETHAGQRSLDLQAAGYPRLEGDALSPQPADRSATRPRRRRKGIRSGRAPARTAHPGSADTSPLGARHRAHLAAYCVWKPTLISVVGGLGGAAGWHGGLDRPLLRGAGHAR